VKKEVERTCHRKIDQASHISIAENVPQAMDILLKPPYLEGRVRRIFERLSTPGFQSRNLEFFFLRVDCHFYAVPYSSVEWIKRNGTNLIVKTHDRHGIIPPLSPIVLPGT
jgi:hypothetical protein